MSELNLLGHIPSAEKRALISDLLSDVNSLRLMILRLENQILRNEAEVETLLAMRDREPVAKPAPPPPVPSKVDEFMLVSAIVEEALPHMPKPFNYARLIAWCLSKHPSVPKDKLKRGVYVFVWKLKHQGRLTADKDGYMSVA